MKIRYVNLSDAPQEWQDIIRVWRNSPRVRREMLTQTDISPEAHARWLAKVTSPESNDRIRIAVSEEGIPFGILRLMGIDKTALDSDWGLYVGDENFLGRGLGKKMLDDLLEWAFVEEKLKELHTTVRKGNKKALAMYEAVGFRITGETGDFYEMSLRKSSAGGVL